MRWMIAGLLAYFAYGSFGLVWQDYRLYRTFLSGDRWALGMGGACTVGAAGSDLRLGNLKGREEGKGNGTRLYYCRPYKGTEGG